MYPQRICTDGPIGAESLSEAEYSQFLCNELENHIVQLGADTVAAFIAEPIMGAGGVLVAPTGYHAAVASMLKKYDILMVVDEVVTAFGRLGEWFTCESVFGFVPDVLVVAKGINSGYIPLGAAIFSSEIYDVISQPQVEGGVFSMGFTYTGHAVACAAARLKILKYLKQKTYCITSKSWDLCSSRKRKNYDATILLVMFEGRALCSVLS